MKYGSLFSGIEGFGLGFESAGMVPAWRVEIDKNAQSVLRRHWPEVPIFDDVKAVGRGVLEPVDLIAGGFPCQDLSVAGKRAGLAGDRSGLWFEFHRIIGELRPTWVVVENVPGLLSSHKGRDFLVVLQGLEELGYGWAYRVLDSQFFGVPQRRRRVFVVGHLGDGAGPAEVLFEPESLRGDSPPSREAQAHVAAALTRGASSGGVNPPGRRQEDDFNIVISTLQGGGKRGYRVDAETAAGGGASRREVVAALTAYGVGTCGPDDNQAQAGHLVVAEERERERERERKRERKTARTLSTSNQRNDFETETFVGADWPAALSPTLNAAFGDKQGLEDQHINGGGGLFVPGDLIDEFGQGCCECLTPEGPGIHLSACSCAPAPHADPDGHNGRPASRPVLAGIEALAPQGVGDVAAWDPRNVTSGVNRTRVEPGLPANTLHSGGLAVIGVGVRRLTPRECERLQGFPDDHTAWGAPTGHTIKDGPRYRMLGNAVTVNVIEWIGTRIAAYEAKEAAA